MPALGAFVPYYILIISQEHHNALHAVLTDKKINLEFELLKKKIQSFIKNRTNCKSIISFEHGGGNNNKAGCCVGHTHLHILPHDQPLRPAIEKQLGKAEKIKNYSALNKLYKKNLDNYLLLEENDKIYLWRNPPILSQYMRRLIAKQIKQEPLYDWQKHPFYENMEQTIRDWKSFFRSA